MSEPLMRVRGLRREFSAGDQTLVVLNDVDLDIEAGELVAIVGQSGSGKSTLMNILGCLDRPSGGSYRVNGRETGDMEPDELAELRREHFGFIFQRYHLLADLSAIGNVEVPAIYAGMSTQARHQRAEQLLTRLGLAERTDHRPGELSGGQQQRVSIARALMNGGAVILADEPTGALDTRSGKEVMAILLELHAEGHTVVLVTHDMAVAEHAQRIIEISDGRIVSDRRTGVQSAPATGAARPVRRGGIGGSLLALRDRFIEAFRMALRAMNAHRMRTFMTMLGIIIGIASVVSVVALGTGARQEILSNISSLGTNTIEVYPGTGFGDLRASQIETLTPGDSVALARQRFVDSATPSVATTVTAQYGNQSATLQVSGVGDSFFRVRGLEIDKGQFFGATGVDGYHQVVVIDPNTRDRFFAGQHNPIGQTLLLGKLPVRVIGVTRKQAGAGDGSMLNAWVPYTTAMARMLGQSHVSSITVRISDDIPMSTAEQAITGLLTRRHGSQDFFTSNNTQIRETIEQTTGILTMMISSIAAIALVVGGIGVMNIMLVSVTERTREIGVRVAVGARRSDILQQFLIESVLVCLLGGVLGIIMALGLGMLLELADVGFGLVFSAASIVAAFVCSSLIGIVFGFLPARSAARLDPVEALIR